MASPDSRVFKRLLVNDFLTFIFVQFGGYIFHPIKMCVHSPPHSIRSYQMNRTIAIDMRGFDWSERPIGEKNYILPYLVEDLKALVKYLSE